MTANIKNSTFFFMLAIIIHVNVILHYDLLQFKDTQKNLYTERMMVEIVSINVGNRDFSVKNILFFSSFP